MNTIESIGFIETVLIPAKNKFKNSKAILPSFYAGKMTEYSEKTKREVHVIFFNCEELKSIEPIIDYEINVYTKRIDKEKDILIKNKLEQDKKYFEGIKKDINTSVSIKKAQSDLLEILNGELKLSLKSSEDVILVSAVSHIIEKQS